MNSISPKHPGIILLEDFLIPLGITAYRLSKITEIPQTRISQIIKGKRRITADTALRLGTFFDVSAVFWLNLQSRYDIFENKLHIHETLKKIKKNRPSLRKRDF